MPFKDIESAIDVLIRRTRPHSKYKLQNLLDTMKKLGNPENNLKFIHITGTNGKGSTTDYVRSILQTEGYKVGTFTSPHLISHHDRFKINNVPISDEKLLDLIHWSEPLWNEFQLSMFEIDTLIAIQYFLNEKVDYVVFEVGLGGRLDATNIISTTIASVITNIGRDHTNVLGNTLEEIAREKAGIIKESGIVVTGEKREALVDVFRQQAKREIYRTLEHTDVRNHDGLSYSYRNQRVQIKSLALYQIENSKLAFEVAYQLNKQNIVPIKMSSIIEGLGDTMWWGRFEKMGDNPPIYIDGAHNPDGIRELARTLSTFDDPITVVFSALKDKEYDKMMSMIETITDDIIVTEFDFERAGSMEDLALGHEVQMIADYKEAIETGIQQTKGILVITGSLYFISDVRAYLKGRT